MKINLLILLVLTFFCNSILNGQSGPQFGMSSNLSTGEIYKLGIKNSGVYSIDYNFLKDTLGIEMNSVDHTKIQIFTRGEGKIVQALSASRIDDLQELPIWVSSANTNGSFAPGDELVFYAPGPHNTSDFEMNTYDNYNYLFLKIGPDNGKRVSTSPSVPNPAFVTDLYNFSIHYEVDNTNLLGAFASTNGSGQRWFGEEFSNERIQNFSNKFDLTDLNIGDPLTVQMEFAGRSSEMSSVNLSIENFNLTKNISRVNTGDIESTYARIALFNETFTLNTASPNIQINYLQNGDNSEGWLDYIRLSGTKRANYRSNPLLLSSKESTTYNSTAFNIKNANSDMFAWDISDIFDQKSIPLIDIPEGASLAFESSELKKFVVFGQNDIRQKPTNFGKINNQNLHSLDRAQMIVIYHKDFEEAALKISEHRRSHDQLEVVTVEISTIYNEFSSGKQDPTAIRDFVKMIFDRDENFNYLLLIGDGSYDSRGILVNQNWSNFIPTYETIESLNPLTGFPSDDYFALLNNNEGADLKGALDIAVGRIPSKTAEEALIVVDKLINYDTNPETFGDWRLKLAFLADDEDSNTHLVDADQIAVKVNKNNQVFNQEKIYFDSFIQESTPGGARYPDANEKFNNEIFKGLLVSNYLGHGGPKGWSQERVLKIEDINSWKNKNKLPLIVTATCSFTGFDDPALVTAGEAAILNPNGGAVGLFSTVRAVYASQNSRLTNAVYDTIFTRVDGEYLRIGEVLKRAKNSNRADTISINARKFLLIGDPSMKLAIPEYDISTTSINGKPASEVDTLKALQKVEVSGEILDYDGSIKSDFSGTIFPTVFDKATTQRTLANDPRSFERNFEVQRNVIFKGSATVTNGKFSFSFVIPIDINYDFGNGKISYYAQSDNSEDAGGFFNQLIIGGTDSTALADDKGPTIELFMNNESFAFGGITNSEPTLIAKISDDNGINISGTSIGHDITGLLDQNTQNSFILNDFYTAQKDDFTQGIVRFPLTDIEEGVHQIRVKAFDIANNAGEGYTEFVVVNNLQSGINRLINYPNPFTTKTTFSFEHGYVNSLLEVQLDIYTVSGKVIKTIQTSEFSDGFRMSGIEWDGKDDFGNSLGRGIYLYKVKIFNKDLNISTESAFEKLVLLN